MWTAPWPRAWRRGQDGRWARQAPRARTAVLQQWAGLIEAQGHELAVLESMDMGKPVSDVLHIDLPEVLKTIRYFAECIDKVEGAVTATRCHRPAPDHARNRWAWWARSRRGTTRC